MEKRKQSVERIKEVTKALSKLQTFDDIIEDLEDLIIKEDMSFFTNAPNLISNPDSVKLPTFSMNLPTKKKDDKTFQYKKDKVTVKAILQSNGTFHTHSLDESDGNSYQSVSFGIFYAPNMMLMQVLGYAVWDATVDEIRGTEEQPETWLPTSSDNWKYSYQLEDGKSIKVFNITPKKEELLTLTLE